ncbi:MAG TPA: hypothetical protein VF021_05690, partial [Longimicrobiales bacterium]
AAMLIASRDLPPNERGWRLDDPKSVGHAIADAVFARYLGEDDNVRAASAVLGDTAFVLTQWLGPDGSNALLTRALERAKRSHHSLRDIRLVANSAPVVLGLADSVAAEGFDRTAAGLNAIRVELFDLLVRMVGEELTMKLAQQIRPRDATDVKREESAP